MMTVLSFTKLLLVCLIIFRVGLLMALSETRTAKLGSLSFQRLSSLHRPIQPARLFVEVGEL